MLPVTIVTIAGHYRHHGAGQYRHCSLPLEDLLAEGNLGLLAAVQKDEGQRGCRFRPYTGWWLR
jgi:DNA-directed RNA polymerase sigma subunit (sigma70/sigma32)